MVSPQWQLEDFWHHTLATCMYIHIASGTHSCEREGLDSLGTYHHGEHRLLHFICSPPAHSHLRGRAKHVGHCERVTDVPSYLETC